MVLVPALIQPILAFRHAVLDVLGALTFAAVCVIQEVDSKSVNWVLENPVSNRSLKEKHTVLFSTDILRFMESVILHFSLFLYPSNVFYGETWQILIPHSLQLWYRHCTSLVRQHARSGVIVW